MNDPSISSPTFPRTLLLFLATILFLTTGYAASTASHVPTPTDSLYFHDVLERGDADIAASLIAPKARLHTPEGIYHGQKGAVEFVTDLEESFSDLAFDVRSTSEANNIMVVEFTMTGTHTGTYLTQAADCAEITVNGVATLWQGPDGMTEQWISYDQQTILDQIYVASLFSEYAAPSCHDYVPQDQETGGAIPKAMPEPANPPGAPTCIKVDQCQTAF